MTLEIYTHTGIRVSLRRSAMADDDIENPNPEDGGGDGAARAEADEHSGCGELCAGVLVTGFFVGGSYALVRGHGTGALGTILFILGILGFVLAACACASVIADFRFGNVEGRRQDDDQDQQLMMPPPAPAP
ncbi:hypothetical protein ACP4OV_019404 [Aristida adscensionis]